MAAARLSFIPHPFIVPIPWEGQGFIHPPSQDPLRFTQRLVVQDVLEHRCSIKSLWVYKGGQTCWDSNIFY